MQSRNLKIESTGDYFAGKVKPKIRLQGQWLEIAGFKPGNRVAVHIIGRGFLALRFLEKTESSTTLAMPVKSGMPQIRFAVAAPLAISRGFIS